MQFALYTAARVCLYNYFYLIIVANWQVKLVHDGITSFRGTVYHYYNGNWGILCDEGWSLKSATVVCNQLGLGNAISNTTTSSRGYSVQKFLRTKTYCQGGEAFLKDCPHDLWTLAQDCSGQHVANVICEGITVITTACTCVTVTQYSYHHTSCMHYITPPNVCNHLYLQNFGCIAFHCNRVRLRSWH